MSIDFDKFCLEIKSLKELSSFDGKFILHLFDLSEDDLFLLYHALKNRKDVDFGLYNSNEYLG